MTVFRVSLARVFVIESYNVSNLVFRAKPSKYSPTVCKACMHHDACMPCFQKSLNLSLNFPTLLLQKTGIRPSNLFFTKCYEADFCCSGRHEQTVARNFLRVSNTTRRLPCTARQIEWVLRKNRWLALPEKYYPNFKMVIKPSVYRDPLPVLNWGLVRFNVIFCSKK